LKYLFKKVALLLLFWLGVFLILRISFYLCTISLWNNTPLNITLQSLFRGLRLDLSTIGYLSAVPLLLLTTYYLTGSKLFLSLVNFINRLFIIIYTLSAVGEACLYREWKSKLSMQALQHFLHPSEVFKTTSLGLTIMFFGLSLFFSFLLIFIYNKYIVSTEEDFIKEKNITKRLLNGVSALVIIVGLVVIGIRGGLQTIPIQSSDAFFCSIPIANDAAVNPLWNIIYSIIEYENHFKRNPYEHFEINEAKGMVEAMYATPKDTTVKFLTVNRPNIVYIILESWSAYVSKAFGGDDFAPFIDSISQHGIAFTKMYPPAYVSDQGIPAILSANPSVSRISVIMEPTKSIKLNCISEDLKKQGYQSGFIFGGDLNYGNLKGYVYNKGFDVVKEEVDFYSYPRGKLGVQDEEMQQIFLNHLNEAKTPFVFAWFTLSSHMPYDFEGEKKKLVDHPENDYINSILYTDNSLKHFFAEAKKQVWYNNTLFVIVADHSHASHKSFGVYDAEYHRIPLLFFGEVIKPEWKGKKIDAVFSQADISPTLLYQMDLTNEAKQYTWGKNMFNPYSKHFAYYCSFGGGGFVTDSGSVGLQNNVDVPVVKNCKNDSLTNYLINQAKAFQQCIYEDYRLK
jgi:phosphoglycerol transferase MdoB-like AlkP superfamily enzyme